MSKIKIGDKIAFCRRDDEVDFGIVKSIKNCIFLKEYLIEDKYWDFYLINSLQYSIILIKNPELLEKNKDA